jgi:hypothetical protein
MMAWLPYFAMMSFHYRRGGILQKFRYRGVFCNAYVTDAASEAQ